MGGNTGLRKCSNKRGLAERPHQCRTRGCTGAGLLAFPMGSSAKEVLKRPGVGPNDHFLALGGHSMSVLQALKTWGTCYAVPKHQQ